MKPTLLRLVGIAMLESAVAIVQPQVIHEFPLGTWLENLAPRTHTRPVS